MDAGADSILSHEERELARSLRETDRTPAEAGEKRGIDAAAAERAAERIRAKTDRALVTLAESPYLAEALAEADGATRERLRAALEE